MKLTIRIDLYIAKASKPYDLTLDENLRVVNLRAASMIEPYPLQLMQAAMDHEVMLDADIESFRSWQQNPGDHPERLWEGFSRQYLEVLFPDPIRSTKRLKGGSRLELILRAPDHRRVATVLSYTFWVQTPVRVEVFGPWSDPFAQREITFINMSEPIVADTSLAR